MVLNWMAKTMVIGVVFPSAQPVMLMVMGMPILIIGAHAICSRADKGRSYVVFGGTKSWQ